MFGLCAAAFVRVVLQGRISLCTPLKFCCSKSCFKLLSGHLLFRKAKKFNNRTPTFRLLYSLKVDGQLGFKLLLSGTTFTCEHKLKLRKSQKLKCRLLYFPEISQILFPGHHTGAGVNLLLGFWLWLLVNSL